MIGDIAELAGLGRTVHYRDAHRGTPVCRAGVVTVVGDQTVLTVFTPSGPQVKEAVHDRELPWNSWHWWQECEGEQ